MAMNFEGNYERFMTKVSIRAQLEREGLTPDDLMKTHLRDDPVVGKALYLMGVLGISLTDLKEGTLFENLQPGKNIYGEDIKEGENAYGQKISILEEEKRQRAEAEAAAEQLRNKNGGFPRCDPKDNPAFSYAFHLMEAIAKDKQMIDASSVN